MLFDATVTVGNVLVICGALVALLGGFIWYVGSNYFPSKAEMKALRAHVDARLAETRTDVESAVRKMENLITVEIKRFTDISKERYDRQVADFARLESTVIGALGDVREARDTARDARNIADNTKEMMLAGIAQINLSIQSLHSRRREED